MGYLHPIHTSRGLSVLAGAVADPDAYDYSVAAPFLWLRPSDLGDDGSAVLSWPDASGGGNNLPASGNPVVDDDAVSPNGLKGVSSAAGGRVGSASSFLMEFAFVGPFTVFVAFTVGNEDSYTLVSSSNPIDNAIDVASTANSIQFGGVFGLQQSLSPTSANTLKNRSMVAGMRMASGNSRYAFTNSSETKTGTNGLLSDGAFGFYVGHHSGAKDLTIHEVVYFNSGLTNEQFDSMVAEIYAKRFPS